jgi:hypothetical protein
MVAKHQGAGGNVQMDVVVAKNKKRELSPFFR